ncbi:MIT domain-containing protein 1 [Biomphalaria glabrata]|nr:MIT domain-containing protein 1 [Biomphalaria glabrata]
MVMADDKISGVEASAIDILKRAVELDKNRRFEESLTCYQEGVGLLMQVHKAITDAAKKLRYREKLQEYLVRAEDLKAFLKEEKEASKKVERIQIEADSTGHSYETLFGHYFNKYVTEVEVDDPYIRKDHQIDNFIRLCELIVGKKIPVKTVTLTTSKDPNPNNSLTQHDKLLIVGRSLFSHGIELKIKYSDTLHDREIRLNTGWVIKIGRGLDYFKVCDRFNIGFCDLNLRKCHETTVDIFHQGSVRATTSTS